MCLKQPPLHYSSVVLKLYLEVGEVPSMAGFGQEVDSGELALSKDENDADLQNFFLI